MKKKLLFFMVLVAITINYSLAQSWEKTKPYVLYAVDKYKNVDSVKVGIGTGTPNFPLEVKGKIVADSIHIHNRLKVGDSSLVLDASSSTLGPLNNIYTTGGDLLIQSNSSTNFNTILNAYSGCVGIGLGTATPNNLIQVLDLINFDDANNSTYLGFQAGLNTSSADNNAVGYPALYLTI